jgi:hypothetical protein
MILKWAQAVALLWHNMAHAVTSLPADHVITEYCGMAT